MTELHERLSKTIAILEKVKEADMANADTQEVIIKSRYVLLSSYIILSKLEDGTIVI
jgi:hypothetical protein